MSETPHRLLEELLGGDAEQRLGAAIVGVVRPLIAEAFQQGFRAGIATGKEAVEHALAAVLSNGVGHVFAVTALHVASTPRTDSPKRPRVASGTLRPLVELILSDQPGLRVAEIQEKARELDDTISLSSVGNELRRNEGTRYRQDGKHWSLIGEPERELGLAPATVPDSLGGPAEVGTPSSAGPPSLAGRLGQAAA
jgi:hypothetical protein